MRISLKDALVIVAFCAGIAWCAGQVGLDNGMFWFSVVVSGAMSALFIYGARGGRVRFLAFAAPLAIIVLHFLMMGMMVFPSLFLNSLLLIVVGIVFAFRCPKRLRTVSIVAGVVALTCYGVGVYPGWAGLHELRNLQDEFPIVSLASRLQYEKREGPQRTVSPLVLNVSLLRELDEVESEGRYASMREHEFQMLHDRQYELFVRSVGFGVGRMLSPYREDLQRPSLRDIRFGATSPTLSDAGYRGWHGVWSARKSDDIAHLHTASRDDFFDPDSFGAVLERITKVVGFVPHAFHYPPAVSLENARAWIIERLELVSLLKFDEPRAYVLDHLPRMDQLSGADVPTRALDEFETGALAKLRTEGDVVTTHDGDHYRMLGSLRAAKQCLDCHSVERGELLGAFSYRLERGMGSAGN